MLCNLLLDGLKWSFVLGTVLSKEQKHFFAEWLVNKYCDEMMRVTIQSLMVYLILTCVISQGFSYIMDVLMPESIIHFLIEVLEVDYAKV